MAKSDSWMPAGISPLKRAISSGPISFIIVNKNRQEILRNWMKKPEVALVRPNYHSHLITPPLGLGYLSSYLKNEGYKTRIIDGLNLNHSVDHIVNQCDGSDIVGISCMSAYFPETAELSNRLKANGFTVVVGGPHASALPELTLEVTRADYIIIGEGELSLSQLVDKIEDN